MKKPETDRELVDMIVNTLENGEEHYILGSWESFVKKRKQRRKLILWFTTTDFAASVLIGWMGFRLFTADPASSVLYSGLKQKITNNHGISAKTDTTGQNSLTVSDTLLLSVNNKVQNQNNRGSIQKQYSDRLVNQVRTGKPVKAEENKKFRIIASAQPVDSSRIQLQSEPAKTDLTVNSGKNETGKFIAAGQSTDSSLINSSLRFPVAEIKLDDYTDIQNNAAAKKIRFGVTFSPGVSSTNTVSSFSYSGGLSADFDISRHFGLSTGFQIERQNVINETTDNPSWIPAGQTEAVLVGIALPVNITWKFLVRESICYYVSGGISSVAYLSENYTTTSYSQKMVGVVNMAGGESTIEYQLQNVENTEQTKEAPFNSFDFAGRINIIFGFEQHLSSKVYLHLEPYVKIPVSGLATHNLKFTTSGITCKISF
jgi:hypothetical protein